MTGYKHVVEVGSPKCRLEKDEECLSTMAAYLNRTTENLWKELSQEKYDYNTATYLLLLQRKQNKIPVRFLKNPSTPVTVRMFHVWL